MDRPLPQSGGKYVDRHVSKEAEPFWDGLREEQLRVQSCDECAEAFFPPRVLCPYCASTDLSWVSCSGRGQLYTYTVLEWAPREEWSEATPYTNVLVELEEGAYIFSEVIETPFDELHIGMDVEIVYDHVTEEITLPRFVGAAVSESRT